MADNGKLHGDNNNDDDDDDDDKSMNGTIYSAKESGTKKIRIFSGSKIDTICKTYVRPTAAELHQPETTRNINIRKATSYGRTTLLDYF